MLFALLADLAASRADDGLARSDWGSYLFLSVLTWSTYYCYTLVKPGRLETKAGSFDRYGVFASSELFVMPVKISFLVCYDLTSCGIDFLFPSSSFRNRFATSIN